MKTLPKKIQIKLDIAMAYFHPQETIFNEELQEEKMLEALKIFSKANGQSDTVTNELRAAWFGKSKQNMYDILNRYIKL